MRPWDDARTYRREFEVRKITAQDIIDAVEKMKQLPVTASYIYYFRTDWVKPYVSEEDCIQYFADNGSVIVIDHQGMDYLKYCLEVITAYLDTLELTLNGKTQIFPFKNGVSYLGFHTYITPTGKPIRKLKNQNNRNAQKKFMRMAKLVTDGKLSMDKFQASYHAWKNHISHGNCYNLGKSMDTKIMEIISGEQTEKECCNGEGVLCQNNAGGEIY